MQPRAPGCRFAPDDSQSPLFVQDHAALAPTSARPTKRISVESHVLLRVTAVNRVRTPSKGLKVLQREGRGRGHAGIRKKEIAYVTLRTSATRQNFALVRLYREATQLRY